MFTKTRLQLTVWYLLIIMVVSVAFSAVIYKVLSQEVERFARAQRFRIERALPDPRLEFEIRTPPMPPVDRMIIDPDLVLETKQRIIYTLIVINGVILIFSGGLGYILAGRTLHPIREMLNEQSRFISDASHELKTPITAIKAMMEVEARNPTMTVSEAKDALNASIMEMNKLQKLTQSLLELAQSEASIKTLPFSRVSLVVVLTEVKHRVHLLLINKSIELSIAGSDVKVKGNADRLTDALVIFLDNAIKYSAKNSKISVAIKSEKGMGKIIITDQGMGIVAKDLPHIFDRFYRGDVSRSKNDNDGYGLGLSIAKQIIELHNGKIEVASKKSKGTIVSVSIPL